MTVDLAETSKLIGKKTFKGGVHPPHHKNLTEDLPIEMIRLRPSQMVVVPMSQHLGAPCQPTVEAKQAVTAGQVVGSSEAFVSAPVHSPVNGMVKEVSPQPHPSGRKVLSVVIETAENQPEPVDWCRVPADFNPGKFSKEEIAKLIRTAGIVGQGGAAFPAAVKLTWNPQRPVTTVIINGCECEPYLTSDYRLMLESPRSIVAGLQLAIQAVGASRGIIAIEDNKPEAINGIYKTIQNLPNIQLAVCRTKYPQGGERQLINAVLGKVVPTGGLPLEVQVVMVNVGTASSIFRACSAGQPVTERIVTVTGAGIRRPGNFRVPVGMMLKDLVEWCGGLTEDAAKVLLGGPMMGPTTPHLDVPILKGTSGITVLTEAEISRKKEAACIRCCRCVDHCPLKLVPTQIAHAVKAGDLEMAQRYDLMACVECGCCSYVCPSHIPLVQYLRSGKARVRMAGGGAARKG
jgi:electron transport complex protein RnfC